MDKNENMKFSELIEEFNWVLSVLNSVESRTQLPQAENCFELWRKKYSDYTNIIIGRLSNVYRINLKEKEETLKWTH